MLKHQGKVSCSLVMMCVKLVTLIHAAVLLHAAKRGVSPSYIKVLRDIYSRLKARLIIHSSSKADGSQLSYTPCQYPLTPDIFVKPEKGTRQGAISSP